MEELVLLSNDQLAVTDTDQLLDTSCHRDHLLFQIRAINSSMLDETLDITLFGYNLVTPNGQHIARLTEPFFSLGM